MRDKQRLTAIAALIASFTGANHSLAQQEPVLEEVLVTAQKREQSIQEVPLSIVLVYCVASFTSPTLTVMVVVSVALCSSVAVIVSVYELVVS